MKQVQDDVRAFHEKFGCYIGERPCPPTTGTQILRRGLVKEEISELEAALQQHDLPEIADAIADSIYVLVGLAISYGIDLVPVWDAVQKSNMSKTGERRHDGKITKGPDFVPPDIAGILRKQGWEG